MKRTILVIILLAVFVLSCLAFTACSSNPVTLRYILTADGTSYIVSEVIHDGRHIEIPSTHNGLPVTGIGYRAFVHSGADVKKVTIPASVTSIDKLAFAGSGYSGLTSIIFEEGSQLTTIGESAFANCPNLKNITIPSGVTSIGRHAFYDCYRLKNITIPASVTSIGEGAFEDCTRLESIIFEEGSQLTSIDESAFANCTSLKDIKIPSSVTSIGGGVFRGCDSLTSITIPFASSNIIPPTLKTVIITGGTSIPSNAFEGCKGLKSITIPSSVTSIGEGAFKYCGILKEVYISDLASWLSIDFLGDSNPVSSGARLYLNGEEVTDFVIPEGATKIGDYALSGCTSLTNITIPSSVTSIGEDAFADCTNLSSITIGGSPQIGVNAFGNTAYYRNEDNWQDDVLYIDNCLIRAKTTIETCTIKEGTTVIAGNAFSGCELLESITIPDSVTSIGEGAFRYCQGITSITIPKGVTSIGSVAFEGCTNLTSITIPSSVTSIGDYAFRECTSIENITIPQSVISIGESAFYECDNLTSVTFEEGSQLERIGDIAFYGCKKLESITIPSSVISIGERAFFNCANLKTVIFEKGSQLTSIGDEAFSTDFTVGFDANEMASIIIPASVTSIGEDAFCRCGNLSSITIEGSPQIGVNAFGGTAYYRNEDNWQDDVLYIDNCLIRAKTTIETCTIKEGTTVIAPNAFKNCASLTSIIIPDSVTSIGGSAFAGCNGLTSITLPSVGVTVDGAEETEYKYLFYVEDLNIEGYYQGEIPSSLTTIVITSGSIGDGAFEGFSNLTSLTIFDGVTSIGEEAFRGCKGLTSITIPNSVTSIGKGAFDYCRSLESITIPFVGATLDGTENPHFAYIFGMDYLDGNTSVYMPSSLTTVVITGGTTIGDYAFYDCEDITSITIPASVTSIGNYAFSARNLTNVTFEEGSQLKSIGSCAFSCDWYLAGSLDYSYNPIINTIPKGVTRIGDYAFEGCIGFTSITIPNSVTSIGAGAFSGCDNLTSVIFEEGSQLESIGEYAFSACEGLTSIAIPASVTSIGDGAFSGCESLIEVCNKSSLTITVGSEDNGDVGYYAKHIITDESDTFLTTIDDYIFYDDGTEVYFVKYVGNDTELTLPDYYGKNYVIYDYAFDWNETITSITIPNSVTSIGDFAFHICDNLTNITFKEGSQLTSIGKHAFASCDKLTIIMIPDSVTSIGDYAFSGCASLTSITIPDGVTSIGDHTFSSCISLTNITIPSSVTSINPWAFSWSGLESVTFEDPNGWYRTRFEGMKSGISLTLTDPSQNATYLIDTYQKHYWYKD